MDIEMSQVITKMGRGKKKYQKKVGGGDSSWGKD